MATRLFVRASARADAQSAADWYVDEAGEALGQRFLDDLQTAFQRITRQPGMGSPRWADALDLPNLRVWPLTHFPYQIYYLLQVEQIVVWRVLHGARDIPSTFAEADSDDPPEADHQ